MNHLAADMSKIEIVECLYHRTYMTHPLPTLHVSINGEYKEYNIRWRATKRDNLYHSKGLPCVLIVYEGIVLAYELVLEGNRNSVYNIHNLHALLERHDLQDGWYFDYEKFYRIDAVPGKEFIGTQMTRYIDPIHLTYSNSIDITHTDVIVVTANDEVVIQSPPISNSLDRKSEAWNLFTIDQDVNYVSLACLLNICNSITKMYGGEIIERFDIPQYMIRHKTVNLANLPKYVKDNSSTSEKPVTMLSYIMGLMLKETSFDNVRELTRLLKMICRTGVVDVRDTKSENIYKEPITMQKINLRERMAKIEARLAAHNNDETDFDEENDENFQ